MTKESLLEMGLTEEQANKVMEALGGNYVTKTRFNEVNAAKNQLEKDLDERDKQLGDLKKSAGDNEELRNQISALQKENKDAKEKHEDDMKNLALTSAIKVALAGKVHDVDLVAGLFDKEKLTLEGETVKGLEEQMKELQEGKAFLFKPDKMQQGYHPAGGGGNSSVNPFQKETWNMTEQGKLLKENPAQAKEMAAAAGVTI